MAFSDDKRPPSAGSRYRAHGASTEKPASPAAARSHGSHFSDAGTATGQEAGNRFARPAQKPPRAEQPVAATGTRVAATGYIPASGGYGSGYRAGAAGDPGAAGGSSAYGGSAGAGGASGQGGRFSRPPRPSQKKRSKLPIVLMVLGAVLLLAAGGMFVWTQIGYKQATDSYGELEQFILVDGIDDDGVPEVDFDALAKVNPDIVAWIYVPGTNINYPVVQRDNEYYLDRLFDGTTNASGTIFLDESHTRPGGVDEQTTLYGHHMMNGQMFNIVDLATAHQEDFDTVEKAYYITRTTTYVFTPMFTTRVAPDTVEVRNPYPEGGLASYLTGLYGQAHSIAPDAADRLNEVEKVLTLVTCNYDLSTKQRSIMVLGLESEVAHEQKGFSDSMNKLGD